MSDGPAAKKSTGEAAMAIPTATMSFNLYSSLSLLRRWRQQAQLVASGRSSAMGAFYGIAASSIARSNDCDSSPIFQRAEHAEAMAFLGVTLEPIAAFRIIVREYPTPHMLAECSMLARPNGVSVKSISKSVYGCPLAQSGEGSTDCPVQVYPGIWIGAYRGSHTAAKVRRCYVAENGTRHTAQSSPPSRSASPLLLRTGNNDGRKRTVSSYSRGSASSLAASTRRLSPSISQRPLRISFAVAFVERGGSRRCCTSLAGEGHRRREMPPQPTLAVIAPPDPPSLLAGDATVLLRRCHRRLPLRGEKPLPCPLPSPHTMSGRWGIGTHMPLESIYIKIPEHATFEGTGDLREHLVSYQAKMQVLGVEEPLMCKAFLPTLKGLAQKWFLALPSSSIRCFNDLADRFLTHYAVNIKLQRRRGIENVSCLMAKRGTNYRRAGRASCHHIFYGILTRGPSQRSSEDLCGGYLEG
nr:uncharacterized protein LOC109149038 [Ipomoea batatas]